MKSLERKFFFTGIYSLCLVVICTSAIFFVSYIYDGFDFDNHLSEGGFLGYALAIIFAIFVLSGAFLWFLAWSHVLQEYRGGKRILLAYAMVVFNIFMGYYVSYLKDKKKKKAQAGIPK